MWNHFGSKNGNHFGTQIWNHFGTHFFQGSDFLGSLCESREPPMGSQISFRFGSPLGVRCNAQMDTYLEVQMEAQTEVQMEAHMEAQMEVQMKAKNGRPDGRPGGGRISRPGATPNLLYSCP